MSESYTYDPAGNMLSKTAGRVKTNYTYNAANQLVGDGTFDYTYDRVGNLLKKQSDGGSVSYAYNARNLLESWTDGEHSESYRYNASGLLSSVTTDASTTSLTWDTLYGEGVVISADTDGEVTEFTYGLERISAVTGKARTEYVYDARGSVIAEVSKAGLLSGTKVTTKSYTPFGEQIGEQTSGFGWNGEYYNAATGMVYFRARFYEPEMNRFSQKDLLRGSMTTPQTLNRYAYCGNDPINHIDPSGMRMVVDGPRDVSRDLIVPTGKAATPTTPTAPKPASTGRVSDRPTPAQERANASAAQTAQNVRVQNRLDELDERGSGSKSGTGNNSSGNNGLNQSSPSVNSPTTEQKVCNPSEENKGKLNSWLDEFRKLNILGEATETIITTTLTENTYDLSLGFGLITISHSESLTNTQTNGQEGNIIGIYFYSDTETNSGDTNVGAGISLLTTLEGDFYYQKGVLGANLTANGETISYNINAEIDFKTDISLGYDISRPVDDSNEIVESYSINIDPAVAAAIIVYSFVPGIPFNPVTNPLPA